MPVYTIEKVDEGLYHLYYDSSTAKTTIVEFDEFLALIEVPIRNEGGGATQLKDHRHGGERVIRSVQKHFGRKPIKYLIHSHWHPHSISSIAPFIARKITLITTEKNFEKLKPMLAPATLNQYGADIRFVNEETFRIEESGNEIVLHRFLQEHYPATPTPDYLFAYLPRYKTLHTGCMYDRWKGLPVEGKEILTNREKDVNRFLMERSIKPEYFLRGSGDRDEKGGLIPYQKFESVVSGGISMAEIRTKFFNFPGRAMSNPDSVLTALLSNNVPAHLLNGEVYAAIRKNELERALFLATLQWRMNPTDPNAWDTLGETYFCKGDVSLARHMEQQCRKLFPGYTSGGTAVWEKDLSEFERAWKQ